MISTEKSREGRAQDLGTPEGTRKRGHGQLGVGGDVGTGHGPTARLGWAPCVGSHWGERGAQGSPCPWRGQDPLSCIPGVGDTPRTPPCTPGSAPSRSPRHPEAGGSGGKEAAALPRVPRAGWPQSASAITRVAPVPVTRGCEYRPPAPCFHPPAGSTPMLREGTRESGPGLDALFCATGGGAIIPPQPTGTPPAGYAGSGQCGEVAAPPRAGEGPGIPLCPLPLPLPPPVPHSPRPARPGRCRAPRSPLPATGTRPLAPIGPGTPSAVPIGPSPRRSRLHPRPPAAAPVAAPPEGPCGAGSSPRGGTVARGRGEGPGQPMGGGRARRRAPRVGGGAHLVPPPPVMRLPWQLAIS